MGQARRPDRGTVLGTAVLGAGAAVPGPAAAAAAAGGGRGRGADRGRTALQGGAFAARATVASPVPPRQP